MHTVTIKINVVLNVEKASVIVDGCGEFVDTGDEISINASDLDVDDDGNFVLGYKVFAFNEDGRYIDGTNISTIARVSETRYIEYSETEDALIIDKNSPNFTFNLKLWTNLIDSEGRPFMISFNVSIVVE